LVLKERLEHESLILNLGLAVGIGGITATVLFAKSMDLLSEDVILRLRLPPCNSILHYHSLHPALFFQESLDICFLLAVLWRRRIVLADKVALYCFRPFL
jgi:hypothetical protein